METMNWGLFWESFLIVFAITSAPGLIIGVLLGILYLKDWLKNN